MPKETVACVLTLYAPVQGVVAAKLEAASIRIQRQCIIAAT